MAVECFEKYGSRRVTGDTATSYIETEQTWHISGTLEDDVAREALFIALPAVIFDIPSGRSLWLQPYELEEVGCGLWEAKVTYSPPEMDATFAWDTTGGTGHITQSLGTRPYGDAPPDFKGAIGVRKDSVDGVDIGVQSLKFAVQQTIPASIVNPSFLRTQRGLTYHTNQAAWRGFDVGEVLFLGSTGQSQTDGLVPTIWTFEIGENVSGLTVAGISGITKYAWEYVWTYYEDQVDSDVNKLLAKPKWVFVEKVYGDGDFTLLGV